MSETSPLAPAGQSPLTEADPNSLNIFIQERVDTIMNKNPIKNLSDNELKQLVLYYQNGRERFKIESQAKEAKPKGTRKPIPKSIAGALALSSEDLL